MSTGFALVAALGALHASVLAAMPVVALVRARAARRALRRHDPGAEAPAIRPTCVLLRPCAGSPPWMERALETTAAARGLDGVAVRFSVRAADDPAFPIARRVAESLRARGFDAAALVVDGPGANGKAAQLATFVARHPAFAQVIVADADVDLSGVDLDGLRAPLGRDGVAAVWQPVVEVSARTEADRASAALLGASLHAFPLLGRLDPRGLVGKLFAFDAPRAARCGALSAGRDVLGEDMALAAALHADGARITQHPGAARSLAEGRTDTEVHARYTRWLQVVRTQRSARLATYPLLFLGPWLLGALGLGALPVSPVGGAVFLAAAIMIRAFTARVAFALGGRRVETTVIDHVRADRLLARAWWAALRGNVVVWAGRGLQRGADGTWGVVTRGADP